MSVTVKPQTETVLLYQGDDLARLRELKRAVDEAGRSDIPLLQGEVAPVDAARDAHNEFVEEAKTRATTVVLQALGRKRWRSLVSEHPPRKDNDADEAVGINEDTFAEALLAYVNPDDIDERTIVEPVFATTAEREKFLDRLSDANVERLYVVAFALNRQFGEDPKALSAPSPSSSGTSS